MRASALRTIFFAGLLAAAPFVVTPPQAGAQDPTRPAASAPFPDPIPASNPVLERVLREWPAGRIATGRSGGVWSYELGTLLDGMVAEWRATGDGRLFDYVHAAVDRSVDNAGVIHVAGGAPFPSAAHSLEDLEMGRSVLILYRVLQQPRYYTAARFLHDQAGQQPRNLANTSSPSPPAPAASSSRLTSP